MSPLRSYRCAAGHEYEVFERMDDPGETVCPESADGDDDSSICGMPVERTIASTQRPIVKSGTRTFHARRPEGHSA